jgi:tetratricopeptide (TPR) repeat protein
MPDDTDSGKLQKLSDEDALAPAEACALFREGYAALQADQVESAIALLERSADLEGGEAAAVSRAQTIRMLLRKGLLDEALALLERSAALAPEVRWRTLADVLEPIVSAGRSNDAVDCLISAARSVENSRDFNTAFSQVMQVLQTVGLPGAVFDEVQGALLQAAGDRLDARLAIVRVGAARQASKGLLEPALVSLGAIAHEALIRGKRAAELAALGTIMAIGSGASEQLFEDAEVPDPPNFLHECPMLERCAALLASPLTRMTAERLKVSAELALSRKNPEAAEALYRAAAVLFARADDREPAEASLEAAFRNLGEEDHLAAGEIDSLRAWLAEAPVQPQLYGTAFCDVEVAAEASPAPRRTLVEAPSEPAPDPDQIAFAYGGDPYLPRGQRWPRCRGCGDALTFVGEVRAPHADLRGSARGLIFSCNVAPWTRDYESRCGAAQNPDAGGAMLILCDDAPRTPDARVAREEATSSLRLAPPQTPRFAPRSFVVTELAPTPNAVVELGGELLHPLYDTPICHPETQAPLQLALRLGGRQSPLVQIVDGGHLYVFVAGDAAPTQAGVVVWRPGRPLVDASGGAGDEES